MGFATPSRCWMPPNRLRTFFSVFDLLLGIFGSLALAVATLGIVNTLVMAILERRREIGVLKALGAADSDVQKLFFVEAGVMGLFGGIFGVLFGWLLGRAITFGTNRLFEAAESESDRAFFRAVVAGGCGHRVRRSCQPGRGALSCFPCRQAQSR